MSDTNAGEQTVQIQQFNLGYNAEQDRLLLRIGLSDNTELQIWLTCRVTRMIWALLGGKLHVPSAQSISLDLPPEQAVAQFTQEVENTRLLQKMDFATEYTPRPQIKNDHELLAVNATMTNAETPTPSLHLLTLDGVKVDINLNKETILALSNMLQMTTRNIAWDIGLQASAPANVLLPENEPKFLH